MTAVKQESRTRVEQRRVEPVGELVGARAGAEPGVGPVGCREEEQRRRCDVEVGAELALLEARAEELADALLVAAPLGQEAVAAVALEVPPFAHEDGRDVELLPDDGEVRPQREADPLSRRRLRRDTVEPGVERLGARPSDLPEQVLLGDDVVVERGLLDAERLGEVGEGGGLVAPLGEEPGGDAR